MPDEAESCLLIASSVAEDVLNGRVVAIEGARKIWRLARLDPPAEEPLRLFIGLASEWNDNPLSRDDHERDIMGASPELLGDR